MTIINDTRMKGPVEKKHGYAPVHGLKMYYEIHGTGKPLVMIHAAWRCATVFPILTKNRQVIAVELQGHGHTADIDRPLTFEQMGDDVAALLKHLQIEQADFFGESLGGVVALTTAVRHPELVRRVAIYGTGYGKVEDAFPPDQVEGLRSLAADDARIKYQKD